ncbi:hypothetical protein QVD17_15217 [Tagetes erecta]|uniref:Uncharacterized protein n=1 Tax=Tagetes erecta TaxID=13708 RepID=A0AAD8NYG8_TARER|nr:hypothetical protein QVD17_15217 [Tagetes erecta]
MQEVDDPAVIDDDIEKQLLSTSSAAVNDGGGGGSSGKRTMRKVILAIWSAHVFHQISAAVSRVNVSSSSKSSSIPADHQHQQDD